MAIPYARLRSLTARELIRALLRDGFLLDRQTDSHQHYRHADGRRATFPPKTLKRMIEDQARWTEADPKRLDLLR